MQQDCTISLERNAMSEGGIRWMYFDAFSSKNGYETTFTNDYGQGCFIVFECRSFTGKERDEETGYGYFGARYMDYELMTMWLSVDPMSDKYPNISPYAYCAWNPIRVVDPDGMDTFHIYINEGRIYQTKAEGSHCIKFYLNRNEVEEERINNIPSESMSYFWDPTTYQDRDNPNNLATTQYLNFTDEALGRNVFLKVLKLSDGLGEDAKEWDLYTKYKNGAELSSSSKSDAMFHSPERYTADNTIRWDHYHPNINDSYYPSVSDQTFAKDMNSGALVACFLYTQGRKIRFDDLVPPVGYINKNLIFERFRSSTGYYE